MTCIFPIASTCRRNTAVLLVLHGAQIAWSRSNAGGASGGGIMMVPFALTATGSGASYWSGIVLAMAAQCLDTQRCIGRCAAPSLRFCHKHHGCREVAVMVANPWTPWVPSHWRGWRGFPGRGGGASLFDSETPLQTRPRQFAPGGVHFRILPDVGKEATQNPAGAATVLRRLTLGRHPELVAELISWGCALH